MNNEIDNKSGKYIYKITNTINGKCYIGQTKDYKARFQNHKLRLRKNEHENPHLQYAWNKYGANAFTFEILEFAEDYNEREKYYIKLYNSTDESYGYNIMAGGDNPPLCAHSTLSMDDVKQIQNMFIDGCSLDDICDKFPFVTRSHIGKINTGVAWHNESLNYPLKKDADDEIGIDVANLIIDDLLNTSISQKEIAKKYNVSRSCVTNINNGNVDKYYNDTFTYPLRQSLWRNPIRDNQNAIKTIITDIRNNTLTLADIAKKYNVSYKTIQKINNGDKSYMIDDIEYPIRKTYVRYNSTCHMSSSTTQNY